MKIATWNVNSIKARLPRVLEWLLEFDPDIVLLQELKTVEETFPFIEIEDLGYNVSVSGQKSYNGVAIFSKYPIEVDHTRLPGERPARLRVFVRVLPRGIEAFLQVPVKEEESTLINQKLYHRETVSTTG